MPSPTRALPPANLRDQETYLYFKVRLAAAGGLVLAEPLTGTRLGINPQLGDNVVQASLFFRQIGADSVIASPHGRRRLYQYGQVVARPDDADRTPAPDVNAKYKQFLLNQEVPEPIVLWVRDLLAQLPDLADGERALDASGRLPSAAHAKVAQALSRYLTQSGEFGYSLDLHRYQMNLDPLADFLLNVKEGHCERFAGGLNLMLRALGIPARVVKGYRGLEPLEDGHYLVRQRHAHSWVQALMQGEKGPYWLTLDPTPSTERTVKPLFSWLGWLFQRWSQSDNVWRNLIMDYNADQQIAVLDLLEREFMPDDFGTPVALVLVPGAVLAGGYGALRLWRRRKRRTAAPVCALDYASVGLGFYPRFLKLCRHRLHLQPGPGQTPREFGLVASVQLSDGDTDCAAIPSILVDLLYRARCGGEPLSAAEERAANELVDKLEQNSITKARKSESTKNS